MSLAPYVGGYDRVVHDFVIGEETTDVAVYQNIGERLVSNMIDSLSEKYNDVEKVGDPFSEQNMIEYLNDGEILCGIKVGTAKDNSNPLILENALYVIVPFVSYGAAIGNDFPPYPYVAVLDEENKEVEDIPGFIIKVVNKYAPYKIINFEE